MSFSDEVFELLDLLDERRRDDAIAHVRRCHDRLGGVTPTVQALLGPAAEVIGRRWQSGRWTVAQEHAAIDVLDDALGALAAQAARPSPRGTVAVAAAEGEWHVTPARMAAAVFREHGWSTWFLGGSTPASELGRTLATAPVDVVAVSCTLPAALPGAARTTAAALAAGYPVVAGGAAFGPDGAIATTMGARWAPGAAAGAELMVQLLDEGAPGGAPSLPSTELLHDDVRAAALAGLAAGGVDLDPPLLDGVLHMLGVAMTFDAPRVLRDHLVWLEEYLRGRGRSVDCRAVARRLRGALPAACHDEVRVLAAAVDGEAPTQERSQPSEADGPSQSNGSVLLVVEDDDATRELLVMTLELGGHEVVAVPDGERALEVVDVHQPELVLLDVMMPGVDGLTTAERLRQQDRRVPIVFVSARAQDHDVWRGWRAGADSYITKPFEPDELLAEVERVLADSRSRAVRAG